ncbi:MAG TPA: hypothetical protein VH619_06605 [Verrucomicrobiae bacterium]|nr:hypothetical protein [Verrucomicrobiae bacterium]
MSKTSERAGSVRGKRKNPPRTSFLGPVVLFGVLVIVASLSYRSFRSSSAPPVQTNASATPPAIPTAASTTITPSPAPNVDPQLLVSTLAALDGKEPITPAQSQKWNDSLHQLIRQGSSSVQPIQRFLAQNLDANYAGVSGADQLGYNSLRSALLAALVQIGGPEATAAMLQTLQTSIYPTDVAAIAKTLEAQSPGQFQQDILNSVRQQLSLAAMDQLAGANVGPLFQVLANIGAAGGSVEGDLAQYAEKWPYYAVIALTTLPNNAGAPALIQIADGTLSGNQTVAGQALAELAPQNPDALNALLALIKSGQLNESSLAQLAPFLGGRQYQLTPPANPALSGYMTFHIAVGDQDFSSHDSDSFTAPQLARRISIIDEVMAVVPAADASAQDTLQKQKDSLTARQPSH